jgi:hypothetical protein
MFKNGEHVDPSKQKSMGSLPIPKPYEREYRAFMQPLLEQLQKLNQA